MNAQYFVIICMMIGCTPKAEKEKYRIPYGYEGQVFIFFNRADGAEKKYENGFRIYDIPTNGILKTKFKPNNGFQSIGDYVYVYVDSKNNEAALQLRESEYKLVDANEICITAGSSGKYGVKDEYEYESFIVKRADGQSKNLIQTNPALMDSVLREAGIYK